ncbi:MAG TPA: hypothetical protein VLE49_14735 [Anaerolineales bacterium]|nr:hypothetical protein [Anaerolineales bacterium]
MIEFEYAWSCHIHEAVSQRGIIAVMKSNRAKIVFLLGLVFSLLIACRAATLATPLPFGTTTATASLSSTATIRPATSTSTPTRTATLEPTLDATVQAEYETAIATLRMGTAASPRTRAQEATLIAQFPVDLENSNCLTEGLSPDGKWLATRCGYGDSKTLVLRSKQGKRWVLKLKDFLRQDISEERTSTLRPAFWSANGTYLYFVPSLGRDGDSDRCFSRHGDDYGLLRLNLNWGTWVALIPPAVSFPGYHIEFSPTGQRYATDADGVRITDLTTGEVTQISVDGVVTDMLWSPDGLHLAYSVARCSAAHDMESAWVYVWDASTKPELVRFSHEGILLTVESWVGNSMLRIREEKLAVPDTIYVYEIARGNLMFRGTGTPSH